MRIIVHPGFHKTGTSSLQAYLAANRAALSGYARIVLLDELQEPLRFATHFCIGRDPFDLAGFTASFADVCEDLAQKPVQTVVISCEGLSGRTPGKRGIMDYAAAVPLANAMKMAISAVFGSKIDLTFLYTTRTAVPWLNSAWRHNLVGYRITQDFTAFCAEFAKAADFDRITDQVARNVGGAAVIVTPLEQVMHQPAKAVLQLLNLPVDAIARLREPGLKNAGISQALATEILAINRSSVTDAEAKRLKAIAIGQRP